MKAMILAAGLGTRLKPYSEHTPKPLFTIGDRPVLEITIEKLVRSGCEAIIINTHHLHQQIESYVAGRDFPVPVLTRHEPEILGTGGGIRNIADVWGDAPLLVINADIVSDIDLSDVHSHHRSHRHPITMVMHDHEQFNSVAVNEEGFVTGFGAGAGNENDRQLAFTGIHVLDRRVLDFLPIQGPAHIIDAYRKMIDTGLRINAYEVQGRRWYDIGTPRSYRDAVYDHMAPLAFEKAFGHSPSSPLKKQTITGDGSDRQWHRITGGEHSLVMADHGIRTCTETQEVDAYIAIGTHLAARNIAVPRIQASDRHAGLVFLQDVGDIHLQSLAAEASAATVRNRYRRVIDAWTPMATAGADGFDTRWCHQTPYFDDGVVLRKECRYFTEAFVQAYLGKSTTYEELRCDFETLANAIMTTQVKGFVHRDFQSRNIMLQGDRIYFIDFQGGRIGPIQYDLASLLIDPYTQLPDDLKEELLDYAVERLTGRIPFAPSLFRSGYRLCAVSRNLQILGAFSFLCRTKGKTQFEQYIHPATRSLVHNLSCLKTISLPKLSRLSKEILQEMTS